MDSNTSSIRQQVDEGIAILKRGGIVAFPTDTVYGLGAGLAFPEAIERIYRVKERQRNVPFPVLIARNAEVNALAKNVPPVARQLMKTFWPGGLTIILERADSVPDFVTAGSPTIGLRIPAHPVPIALVAGSGMPLIGTSANISGRPSPLTAAEVRAQLAGKVELIIDGGRAPGGKESTILDLTGAAPVISREGAVPRFEIEKICGPVTIKKELVS